MTGRLTDSHGRIVNFKNTILIMTSNISSSVSSESSLSESQKQKKILKDLEKYFRPEFINRVDEIILFNTLSTKDMDQIVGLEMQKVRERLKEQGLGFTSGAESYPVFI